MGKLPPLNEGKFYYIPASYPPVAPTMVGVVAEGDDDKPAGSFCISPYDMYLYIYAEGKWYRRVTKEEYLKWESEEADDA